MGTVILDHAPAEVIRRALIQLGLGSEGTAYGAWPVFTEMEPNDPDNVITIYDTDGLHHGRNMPTGEVEEQYGIIIRVRGVLDNSTGATLTGARVARQKLEDIIESLDQNVCRYQISVPDEIGAGSTIYTLHSANRPGTVQRVGRQRNNSERYIFTVTYLLSLTQN